MRVTDTDLDPEVSITLDLIFTEACQILWFDGIHVLDDANAPEVIGCATGGNRGASGSNTDEAVAHLFCGGDLVTILAGRIELPVRDSGS